MAKTYRHIYEQVCSFENVYRAWRTARRGKRGRSEVALFEYDLESNLIAICRELRDGTYAFGQYRSFHIHEPKRRLISAAPFRDRVVHHAMCNVIEPLFERGFIHDSYANRVGRGTHRALDRTTHFMRRHSYVLQCDVRQFFPSIDHQLLMATLARRIGDADVLRLAEQVLAGGAGVLSAEYEMRWFPGDDLLAAGRPRGLPIGNLTSQFWANVYLNGLDHFVKREIKCPAYLRYVDDFLLFADDPDDLHRWRREVIDHLAGLRLTIHEARAVPRPVTEGVTFLGFRVFPDHRRLKRSKVVYWRRFARLQVDCACGRLALHHLTECVRGWVAHARYGDTYGLRRAVLASQPLPRVPGPVV